MFKITKKSKRSLARTAKLITAHGSLSTPTFMTVATVGAVKSLTMAEMKKLQAEIVLSNTYHLYLRPGEKVLKKFKGLHNFMNWPGPILTDSGGYQVFSLSGTKNRKNNLVKISKDGVEFASHLDGSRHFFTPEKVLQIQNTIGSDIMMVLDVCTAFPATHRQAESDLKLTLEWARRSYSEWKKTKYKDQLLFAIVQGSVYKDLRLASIKELLQFDFSGYAIGGLAVGESNEMMYKVLDYTASYLPEDKPRYLMGVGLPDNIVEAVKRGVDMFDCVIPTREARHGRLYYWRRPDLKGKFYQTINIARAKFKYDKEPINKNSSFPELTTYSKAYLHHLLKIGEPLALRLATLHNLEFYLSLIKKIRREIRSGNL